MRLQLHTFVYQLLRYLASSYDSSHSPLRMRDVAFGWNVASARTEEET
jgi:hypothetical protein